MSGLAAHTHHNLADLPAKALFAPSAYQQNFFDWVATGSGSCVLVAVAGSGKTTSVIEALAFVPVGRTVVLLAFNAAIAKELTARVAEKFAGYVAANDIRANHYDPRFVSAKTFHSLGYGAVRKYLEKRGVKVGNPDDKKVRGLAREYLGEQTAAYEMYADYAIRLVGLAKGHGIGCLVPDVDATWYDLAGHHDLYLDDEQATEEEAVAIARELLRRSNTVALSRGALDFDDMLYLVCKWGLRLWQNDWIFVDEAQDTNPVRRALAKLALSPGGRLVAVGDPAQAIYGFTGASHDAIDLLKHEFNAAELPLTVCYRCATDIVAAAQPIVPHLEAFEGAPKGLVQTLRLSDARPHLTAADAVLCRQTAPLIKLAYTLIGQGTGCRVLGRDIGAGLVSLVKRAKARGLAQLQTKLEVYRDREMAKFVAKGQEQKADALQDRVASIFTVVESLDENHRTVPALIAAIEGLFSNETGACLTLSTVHKAKGREWPTVAILEPELMPSKFARQDWQYQQEQNLIYVAYTRAQLHLIFLETEKKPS